MVEAIVLDITANVRVQEVDTNWHGAKNVRLERNR